MLKAIMTVNTDVKKINFTETTKPIGNHISNQIYKKDYFDMCKRLKEAETISDSLIYQGKIEILEKEEQDILKRYDVIT